MSEQKNKKFTMPPVEFSNAINIIHPEWNDNLNGPSSWIGWEDSKAWKLFNAGRAAAARGAERDLKQFAELCEKVVRQ